MSKSVDRYVIKWPVIVHLTRIDSTGRGGKKGVFTRQDYLASTAIPELGEIEISRDLDERS